MTGRGRQRRELRLVGRRTRLRDPKQLQLWPEWRHHVFITNLDGPTIAADQFHRDQATVELAIRDLKEGAGLEHCPSGQFFANAAWLACAVLAHNLIRWTVRLGDVHPHDRLTVARTIRTRLIALPGRIVNRELSDLDDRNLTRVRSRDIGFVFQSFNLIPTLSAAENVEAAMVPIQHDGRARRTRTADLLEQVGLSRRATHLPSRLSGGEQQRVAIARALANEPRVIIADEPTGNLDSATSDEVVRTLQELSAQHGVTVIVVTHAEEVARHAARRLRLRDGQVAPAEVV